MSYDPEHRQGPDVASAPDELPALPWKRIDSDAWHVTVDLNGQPAEGSVRLVTGGGYWHLSAKSRIGILNADGGPFLAHQAQALTAALMLEMVRCGTRATPIATHRSCPTCGTRLPIAWRGTVAGSGFAAPSRCPVCAGEMVAEVAA